jgi:hypothetical protein
VPVSKHDVVPLSLGRANGGAAWKQSSLTRKQTLHQAPVRAPPEYATHPSGAMPAGGTRASSVAYTPARRLIASGPPASLVVDQDPARAGGPDA